MNNSNESTRPYDPNEWAGAHNKQPADPSKLFNTQGRIPLPDTAVPQESINHLQGQVDAGFAPEGAAEALDRINNSRRDAGLLIQLTTETIPLPNQPGPPETTPPQPPQPH